MTKANYLVLMYFRIIWPHSIYGKLIHFIQIFAKNRAQPHYNCTTKSMSCVSDIKKWFYLLSGNTNWHNQVHCMNGHSLIFWHTRFHEAGGPVITFGDGTNKAHRSILRIHHSSFYWKVKFKFQLEFKNSLTKFQCLKTYPHEQIATRGDLGLADAYIDGDFTCADTGAGLINLFMVPWFHSEVLYQVRNNIPSEEYISCAT